MAAAIMRDAAITAGSQEEHLVLPRVRTKGPAVAEDNGLALAPIIEVNPSAVFGGNRVHDGEILTFSADLRIGRWTEAVLLPK